MEEPTHIPGLGTSTGRVFAVTTSAVLISFNVLAQTGGWAQRTPAVSPPARFAHAMAYDSARGKAVLFGGEGASTADLGDTWEWDGTTWTLASTSGPAPRRAHAMAYDSLRGHVLLFGGLGVGVGNFTGTWTWDGTIWTQVATTGPTNFRGTMAYDSQRDRMVLAQIPSAFGGGAVWEWDGAAWTLIPDGGTPSSLGVVIAYDSHRGRTVLFGYGVYGNNISTWEWDGAVWSPMSSAARRENSAMVYDSFRRKTFRFGGAYPAGANTGYSGGTHEWDGQSWQSMGGGPTGRAFHAMAYDSQRRCVVMFGGLSQ